jgi:hypothetical protein
MSFITRKVKSIKGSGHAQHTVAKGHAACRNISSFPDSSTYAHRLTGPLYADRFGASGAFQGVNRKVVQRLRSEATGRDIRCGALNRPVAALAAAAPPSTTSESVMKVVNVELGDRSYPIYIGTGLLKSGELLRKHVPGKRVLIVTNTTIAPLYLEQYEPLTQPNFAAND